MADRSPHRGPRPHVGAGDEQASPAAVRRLTRAFRTLSSGNEAMLHAGGEEALLVTMCRVIVAEGGYEILKGIEFPWPVAETVRQHHERLDGSGYPRGLRGDAILPEARIVAVADVVEAMASLRPYRAGLGIEAAVAEVRGHRGSWFDPEVMDACCTALQEGEWTP